MNDWLETGFHYHGKPVVVNSVDGSMARDLGNGRFEDVPGHIEDLVVDVLILGENARELPCEVLDAIYERSN